MEIIKIDIFRDGGTIQIKTDEGNYYIDRRLGNPNPTVGMVYNDYPGRGLLIPDEYGGNDIKQKIYDSLDGYVDTFYKPQHIESIREFLKELL